MGRQGSKPDWLTMEISRCSYQAKGDAAIPAPPPAPPRFSTASPSQLMRPESNPSRAMSSTPPPSQLARNSVPPSGPPGGVLRTSNVTASFAETADGGIKRMKSSLADSLTPDSSSSGAAPAPPPLGSQTSTAASLDDLLSRPPSKRPSSAAAKKGAKNRYVDILKLGTEGS